MVDLISELQERHRTAVLFISHNLGLIRKACATHRGALRRRARRGRADRADPAGPAPPVHGRPDAMHPARRAAQGPGQAGHDPRVPAADRRFAARLRLRAPLRACRGDLQRGEADPITRSASGTRVAVTSTSAPQQLPRDTASIPVERPTQARRDAAALDRQAREDVHAGRARHQGARRGVGVALAGGDARPRWRVGQRQDDVRPRRCSGSSSRLPARSRSTAERCRPGLRSGRRRTWPLLQIVFQNPDSALNRRHSVRRMLKRTLSKLADVTGAPRTRARTIS